MGFFNSWNCKNYISSCASGLQHRMVSKRPQGINSCYMYLMNFVCESFCFRLIQLISASTDNNVCIWDILSGDCEQKFRFPSPVLKVQFDPRNDSRCLVCPMRYAAVLVDINGTHKCLPLDSDVRKFSSLESIIIKNHFYCNMIHHMPYIFLCREI